MADGESHSGPGRRRRADAERSIEAILDAALAVILADGDLTMAAVARAAEVSRVTLYAHFPTREALVEAVLRRTVVRSTSLVDDVDIDRGPAPDALARLVGSSWGVLSGFRNLHAAAATAMPADRLRQLHEPFVGPFERLISRGQAEGDFRADLPLSWLVATMLNLLHLTAEEVDAGRLRTDHAGEVVTATILGVLTLPPPTRRAAARKRSDRPATADTR
ncbi:MAG: TetR/AcrR family transcriptional regulator [Acidimicrobiales bacterium]